MHLRPGLLGALAAAFVLIVPSLGAQQGTVAGRVIDQLSAQPLAAVQLSIAGTGIGGLTQQNGRYTLQNVPAGTHTLTAQLIGYATVTREVTVTAGETASEDLTLVQQALGLDEIIVTGTPGGTQRRAIGNSVTSVNAAEITQMVQVNTMQDLLGGRSPGVQFTRASGNIGTGSEIQIRGVGSFNVGGNPLIYVDGIRVNNSMNTGPQLGDQKEVNPLDDLNPEDIESIEIIKGPAAGTLYGTEASAGVIQIITKRGTQSTPQFDLSVTQGTIFMRDPAGRIGPKFGCVASFAPPCREGEGLVVYNAYHESNRLFAEGWFWNDVDPYSGKPKQLVADRPWPQSETFQYGHNRSYNLGVRGGTENVRYFLSGNFDDREGTVHYNTDRTYRLRANIGVVLSENFSLDVATGYVDGFTQFGSPAITDGGVWEELVWGNGYCVPRINRVNACERLAGYQEHRPTDIARLETTREYNRFTGSGTLNFTNGGWLSARSIIGVDKSWDENRNLFPLEIELPSVYPKFGGGTTAGELILERPTTTNLSMDVSATATFALTGAVSSATAVGAQYYLKRLSSFRNRGVGFPSPLSRTINQTASSLIQVGYEFVENKSLGVYVQEQLSWNDRLFVTAAVRADDNSAFGTDFDPLIYPKVSATWVISEEPFWNLGLINSLRVRGAWGKAGRQPDVFAGRNQFGVMSGPGGAAILNPSTPGNPAVGPEVSTELELGFDLAVLEDRLSTEFTWFTQKNEDALLGIGIPPSVGFPGSRDQNLGRLDNWGWEVMVDVRAYESRDVRFGLTLTGSMVDNEIKDLGEFQGNNSVRVGFPYPNYNLARWVISAEYDPTGDVSDNFNQRIAGTCDGGVVKIDGKTQPWSPDVPAQYGVLPGGEPVDCRQAPPRIFQGRAFDKFKFSVAPNVNLMNTLQLHVLFDGAYGRLMSSNNGCGQLGCYSNDYQSRAQTDPMYIYAQRRGSWSNQFDGSFWKLREIGARWNLPESMTSPFRAGRASLSLSARELWIIWRKQQQIFPGTGSPGASPGLGLKVEDPELGRATAGQDSWRTMPANTVLSATMRVSF